MSEYSKLLDYLEREKNKNKNEKFISEKKPKQVAQEKKSEGPSFKIHLLEQLLVKKLKREQESYKSYSRPYISVGELLTCSRKCYFSRKGFESETEVFPYLPFYQVIGIAVHELIQTTYNFKEIEKTVKSEKFKVKGKADAVDNTVVYEIKTSSPSEQDFHQAMIYGYILNLEYSYRISSVEVIYVNLPPKQIRVEEAILDNTIAIKYLKKSEELRKALSESKPPQKDENFCKWCEYKNICNKTIDNDVVNLL